MLLERKSTLSLFKLWARTGFAERCILVASIQPVGLVGCWFVSAWRLVHTNQLCLFEIDFIVVVVVVGWQVYIFICCIKREMFTGISMHACQQHIWTYMYTYQMRYMKQNELQFFLNRHPRGDIVYIPYAWCDTLMCIV